MPGEDGCAGSDPRNGVESPGIDTKTCAHLKRFFELVEGDPDVRARVLDERVPREQLLADAGLDLPAGEMGPFWRIPVLHTLSLAERDAWRHEFGRCRLGALWREWRAHDSARHAGAALRAIPTHPRVRRWRERQLSRVRSEQIAAEDLHHFPLLCFELSQGCSVQCWFCSLDPEPLKGAFAYSPDHRRLWRDVLSHSWQLFGQGCQTAICYHGTDPVDNPDFFRFQDDLIEIFGVLPQVTTAQALRNPEWTRTLLEYQRRHLSHHRFSVLTLGTLRKIFRAFTPEDLLEVSLVMQHKEAFGRKVEGGRAIARGDRLRAEAEYRATASVPAPEKDLQTTCECTVGYLVNMVTGRIQLISPADSSPATPLGYRTHAEGLFRTGAEFRAFLDRTIEEHMPERPAPGDVLRFRDAIQYERLPDGFRVTSRFRSQTVRGSSHLGLLGELLQEGTRTTSDVTGSLIDAGMSPFAAAGWVDRVFQTGELAEPR